MKQMRIVTYCAAVVATLILFLGFQSANGAPQEAAAAALALGVIVIPYCITAMQQRQAMIVVALEQVDVLRLLTPASSDDAG
jgi:ABC-type phosphate transport system permease subunit